MGRSLCSCCEEGLKRGPWTPEEDQKLIAYIEEHGHGSWSNLRRKAGLQRCGKSCRLRWTNYLRPDIKRGKFSLHEDQIIIQLHALLGNRWSTIATYLPKRTDNEIKNHWNTHIKKRLAKMGIDPVTHKPKTDALGSGSRTQKEVAHLGHMIQWEKTRLEAEARLVRHSNLNFQNQLSSTALAQPPCLDILRAAKDSELPIPTMSSNSMTEMEFTGSSINTNCESLWIPGPLSNSMQGNFNDLLLRNNGYSSDVGADQNFNNAMGGSGGEFEDNINYWNSILLNLMNSSSPSDSSVF